MGVSQIGSEINGQAMTEWHTETLNLREVAAGRTTSKKRHLIHF